MPVDCCFRLTLRVALRIVYTLCSLTAVYYYYYYYYYYYIIIKQVCFILKNSD